MAAQWYIVQAYSNFEKRVKETLEREAEDKGLADLFEEILVPTETVVEVRRGRKVESERKFFPGYVLVKVDLTDAAYHLIANSPKVTGFLGASGASKKPRPVPEKEVARIIGNSEDGAPAPRPMISFEIGETIKVVDGPFQSFSGSVESVDEEAARLKVLINIFGQGTPVELDYSQVEKES
ncbi:transcription termination/antitermination protein NusG [Algimonas porphyrae]|uniref:Transcription termination/antitermination protein NusG n=1 Tax=Algimonas porphyrae TaxID=1128113 RepID=A0ABQ5UY13_9PROT|nr:transcription termination/antitermination protein NusG [Algimonas porphyrae]GLQ19809.1 transcription termination/antitermination protein NusG [Algimonas porphyrae]